MALSCLAPHKAARVKINKNDPPASRRRVDVASTRRGVDATRRRVDLRDATRRRGRARARDVDVLSVNVLRVSRNGRYVGVRCKGYRLEGVVQDPTPQIGKYLRGAGAGRGTPLTRF